MVEIWLEEKSNKTTLAVNATWPVATEVIAFEATLRVVNWVYCGRLSGIFVRVLLLIIKISRGVVAGMLPTIVVMSESSMPWSAQVMVRVVFKLLVKVGPQTHGAMNEANFWHWQRSEFKFAAMFVHSAHVAAAASVPKSTYPCAVAFKAKNQLKFPQLVAVQSHETKSINRLVCYCSISWD